MMKRFLSQLKEEFSPRGYLLLTLTLLVVTLFVPVSPVREAWTPYQYQYGIFTGWITFYQPYDYGVENFWFQIANHNSGILLDPLKIFLNGMIIYLGYLTLVFMIHGYPKHHL